MINRILSLFEYGYLWNIQRGATDRPPPQRHRSLKWNTASAAAATIYKGRDLSDTQLKCNFMVFLFLLQY